MLLRFYDKNKEFRYERDVVDPKIESEVESGDSTISFNIPESKCDIEPEWYVLSTEQEYVVKEKNFQKGKTEFVCKLNLEDLEGKDYTSFQIKEATLADAVRSVLTGTGWILGECRISKVRNAGIVDAKNALNVIQKLCVAFMCEPVFDTIHKRVSFYEEVGSDKGMYFLSRVNLKSLSTKIESYDYATVLIPIGKDDLTIESVNAGVGYLENYQYSSKRKVLVWKADDYTDPQALKEDAELKLSYASKPSISYSAKIIDLAAESDEYSVLDYGLGDYVWIIDDDTGVRDKQRIVKLTEYPDKPQNNSAEFCNTNLTFEILQKRYKDAADIINTVVDGDGQYNGTIKVSDILHFENGEISNGPGTYTTLAQLVADVGTIRANYLTAEQIDADFLTVRIANMEEASIQKYILDRGTIDFAQIKNVSITDAQIVSMDALKIKTGTIMADRLLIKGEDGQYRFLQVDEEGAPKVSLCGEEITDNTIKAEKIVAGSITAREINASAIFTNEIISNHIFSKDITATGTIEGLTIKGAKGEIAGWNITTDTLYSQNKADNPTASNKAPRYWVGLGTYGNTLVGNGAFGIWTSEWNEAQGAAVSGWKTIFSYDGTITTQRLNATGGNVGGFTIANGNLTSNNNALIEFKSQEEATTSYSGTYMALSNGGLNFRNGKNDSTKVSVTDISTGGITVSTTRKSDGASVDSTVISPSYIETTGWISGKFYSQKYGTTGWHTDDYGNFYPGVAVTSSNYWGLFSANNVVKHGFYWESGNAFHRGVLVIGTEEDSDHYVRATSSAGNAFLDSNPNNGVGVWTQSAGRTSDWLIYQPVLSDYARIPRDLSIGSMAGWNDSRYGVYIQSDGQLSIRRSNGGTLRFWRGTNTANYVNLKCLDSDPGAVRTIHLPNAAGTIQVSSSDIRIKENLKDTEIESALSVIDRIQMYSYDWTDKRYTDPHQRIGFIADELELIDERLVLEGTGGWDSEGEMNVKCVDGFYLQGYEVKAIQELHEKVRRLEAEIKSLKGA